MHKQFIAHLIFLIINFKACPTRKVSWSRWSPLGGGSTCCIRCKEIDIEERKTPRNWCCKEKKIIYWYGAGHHNWPQFWSSAIFFHFIVPSHVWHQWKALLVLNRKMALVWLHQVQNSNKSKQNADWLTVSRTRCIVQSEVPWCNCLNRFPTELSGPG